jgi:hypothetical protein
MSVYTGDRDRARPEGPAAHVADTTTSADPRLAAFAELVGAFDRRDWRGGQLATRALRKLGLSVCLCRPSGDRRPT